MTHTAAWSQATQFDADPESVARARHFVEWHLGEHGRSSLADDLRLIVSELATNAVVHGSGAPFTVSLAETAGEVTVSVRDHGTTRLVPRPRSPSLVESGRGLVLVDAVSAAWGVSSDDGRRTCVWATVPVPDPGEHVGGAVRGATVTALDGRR